MNISRSLFRAALCVGLLGMALSANAQEIHIVTVGDNFFSPSSLTIQVGDTVRWTNAAGGNLHDVTANDGSFSSQTASSFTFNVTFDNAGVFGYFCTVHGQSMSGTITVEGGPAPAELVLQSVNAPAGPFAQGDSITIQSVVENIGGQSSGPYSLTFYASEDSIITSADASLGTANRSSLSAGTSNDSPFNGMIPSDLSPGSYFIGAIVDFEDDSANNNVNLDNGAVQVVDGSGADFVINNGLNDSWFNADTAGQGFFITVFPDIGSIFLAWFTYDTERPPPSVTAILGEPGHRWLTAFGDYAGNVAVLDVELTEGGVFDSADPPVDQTAGYGTIELEFIDCNNAIVRYDIPSAGVMGEIPITRIATDNVPRCLAAQPQ